MRQFLEKILPENDFTLKSIAIGLTVLLAGLLTLWGIYQIGEYGLALFMLTPLFIGAAPSILYGIKKEMSRTEALKIALLSLLVFTLAFLLALLAVFSIFVALHYFLLIKHQAFFVFVFVFALAFLFLSLLVVCNHFIYMIFLF